MEWLQTLHSDDVTVSLGREIRSGLPGGSGSASLMTLRLQCWLGLPSFEGMAGLTELLPRLAQLPQSWHWWLVKGLSSSPYRLHHRADGVSLWPGRWLPQNKVIQDRERARRKSWGLLWTGFGKAHSIISATSYWLSNYLYSGEGINMNKFPVIKTVTGLQSTASGISAVKL